MTDAPAEAFLTLREAVMEIRGDVKDLGLKFAAIDAETLKRTQADHEKRLRDLEDTGFRLAGAWATIGLVTAGVMSLAGLGLGLLSYLG